MTIATTAVRNDFVSTGQSTFSYTFKIFEASDLVVQLDGVTLTLSTDYTVTGVDADNGGTITFVAGTTTGQAIAISRSLPRTRTTDFQQGGAFTASNINSELDRLSGVDEELDASIARSIRLARSDPSTATLVLPPITERANLFLGFDANGEIKLASSVATGALTLPLEVNLGGTGATNPAAARASLQLGTASTANIGTSGAAVPLLNDANIWGNVQTFNYPINTPYISVTTAPVSGTIDLSTVAGNFIDLSQSSNAGFSNFGNMPLGATRTIRFTGATPGTLLAGGNIILPSSASIPIGQYDIIRVVSLGSSNWQLTGFLKFASSPTVFVRKFESTAVSGLVLSGAVGTWAHGLLVRPQFAEVFLRCLSSEGGYSVGAEIPYPRFAYAWNGSSNVAMGATISWDATNVYLAVAAGISSLTICTPSGAAFSPSGGSWATVAKAWI